MQTLIAKIALFVAGDKVKKALVVLGALAIAYVGQYPQTEVAHAIAQYVLPLLGVLGIASGGTTGLQPPSVAAAASVLTSPTGVNDAPAVLGSDAG